MKKLISAILAVVVAVVLLAGLVQIQNLQRKINSMQAKISGLEDRIDRRMMGITERVDSQIRNLLEEQQDVFHSVDFTYGEIHMDRKTVDMTVTAVPKSYSEEASSVCVTVNGQEIPLTLHDGKFTGTVELDLFGESRISDIRVQNQDAVEIQQLNWNLNPRDSVLIQMGAEHTGSYDSEKQNGKLLWSSEALFEVTAYSEYPFEVRSLELVEERNGTEIGRISADLSPAAQKEYSEYAHREAPDEDVAVPEPQAPLTGEGASQETGATEELLYLYSSKTYELSPGDTLIRYLELTDDRGIRYRRFADSCVVSDAGREDHKAEIDMERQYEHQPAVIVGQE